MASPAFGKRPRKRGVNNPMAWPESLLIVDDQAEVRRSLIAQFAALGIAPALILEAKDAQEATALFDRHHPQLTLVDIVLFGNSGFDVLQHIRQADEDAAVMLMTAFPQFDYAMEGIRFRVDHFLVKPVTLQQLESALMDLFSRKNRAQGAGHSFYTRQLDRILLGEEGPSSLEKARQEAGVDALKGESMLFALAEGDIDPAALCARFEALGRKAVAWRRSDGELVIITAFDFSRRGHARALLEQTLRECVPAFFAGCSIARRDVGLIEMQRRAAFALAYAREKKLENLAVGYERLDLGRILLSRAHAALMSAYDSADEARLMDAMDQLMIQLRLHNALSLVPAAFNEMCALENLPPLEEGLNPEGFYPAVVAHFHQAALHSPPPALHLSALRQYCMEHMSAPVAHESLASLTGFSYGYLADLFRQHMGKSLNDYQRALRLRQAAELLAGTPCRVYEVARLTGFEGNKHFYGLFQKAYGVTPTQYHETQYEETEQSKE